ncbi:hypothetical protein AGLY_002495 [Aphis glycines]|uniref:Envelope fusion protein n=1 Tax=Aphis glycines TaxID=307491 RepID=A0A6G0U0J4_APHGL|nr:hypothetical protein AGLY_002495 [Aphis glycines]
MTSTNNTTDKLGFEGALKLVPSFSGGTESELASLIEILELEAEKKKNIVLESIGHSQISKRSIPFKTITTVAQVLYGLCDRYCVSKSNKNIEILQGSNNTEINDIKQQLKIVKLKREEDRVILLKSLDFLKADINGMTMENNIKNYVSNHFIQLSLMLQLHLSATDILFDVIQSAKIGLIHPFILKPKELLNQILDIKIALPSGTNLPIELHEKNIQELVSLSDITIYYSNDKIVPLIYQQELTLYKLISIPVCISNNCLYVKPNYKYLAISRSNELYSNYDEIDQTLCKHASDFLICPEINPLHPRSVRPICVVQLLQDPKEVPDSCETMHVQIRANLFYKLKFKNEWIYATPGMFFKVEHRFKVQLAKTTSRHLNRPQIWFFHWLRLKQHNLAHTA